MRNKKSVLSARPPISNTARLREKGNKFCRQARLPNNQSTGSFQSSAPFDITTAFLACAPLPGVAGARNTKMSGPS
jgi:hypothetical protein